MAQNRVQYQKGLSMPEFYERFGSVQQCEERVRAWRWPNGFVCPRCQHSWHSEFRRHDRLYFQCSSCRYQCSLVSGTIFESSKLPLPSWFLAMHLMTQAKNNVSALELKRHLGVNTCSDNSTQWLSLYLIAAKSFDVERHFRPEQVRRFREWRAEVVRQIEEGAPEYLRPARFDAILSLLFPAMARGLANGKGRVV